MGNSLASITECWSSRGASVHGIPPLMFLCVLI